MSVTDPLYVVALNYRQFLDWCARKGYSPTGGAVRYVRGVETLAGLRTEVRILFIENWDDRSDARALYNRALIIGRRPQ